MWIMWGKIPEHQTCGAPRRLMSDWTVSAAPWDSCPSYLSHFCTKVKDVGFLSFVLPMWPCFLVSLNDFYLCVLRSSASISWSRQKWLSCLITCNEDINDSALFLYFWAESISCWNELWLSEIFNYFESSYYVLVLDLQYSVNSTTPVKASLVKND